MLKAAGIALECSVNTVPKLPCAEHKNDKQISEYTTWKSWLTDQYKVSVHVKWTVFVSRKVTGQTSYNHKDTSQVGCLEGFSNSKQASSGQRRPWI